ncbi:MULTISPECIES: fimbria/pilus outer membrane usher protein [unclassified Serratia (in: enterobacteria)]|uniref:fimbria/pilus outer membrane usher protein n=1 Tax=unclassified Serratia (in: enterobacteria) TaxID=2647522 RepID=UPI0018AC6E11|nr:MULTISPECIES: fimbria/pilus outer membrane usher protein [unclassified Serratia (in: enterobacteria)]
MFKYSLRVAVSACLFFNLKGYAAETDLYFDTDFMNRAEGQSADIKPEINNILQKNTLGEGRYPVLLFINNREYGQVQVEFKQKGDVLVPLIPISLLHLAGVKPESLITQRTDSSGIISDDITSSIPESQTIFKTRSLTLNISIPQIYIDTVAKGYVPPTEWDEGINAARLNYQISAGQSHSTNGNNTNTASAYLHSGLNIAGWRARSSIAYLKNRPSQLYNSYIERDLPGTLGRLMMGELFTQGNVMESIPFRGVQASSDADMLPDAMQGYAPVIRGIANSQAKVEIRQHGYSLYTTFVPPGPFEITDLNTAAGNGDLELLITEANGEERRFTQPYATLGNLLRQDTWRYSIAAGSYNAPQQSQKPNFVQLVGALGLPRDYTASVGVVAAETYRAAQAGVGKGLGRWGAISVDITHAASQFENSDQSGQSYAIRYGKAFSSGTNLRFTGYRYSTSGYRSFTESISERSQPAFNGRAESRRNRLEANITQNIGKGSSIYAVISQQDYWGSNFRESQAQLGFNTMVGTVNVGMYASKSLKSMNTGNQGAEVSLTLSMPLGQKSINTTLARNNRGQYAKTLGISGVTGDHTQLNYNVDASQYQTGSNQISASGGYRTPWAQLSAGVTQSRDTQSGNIGVSGSLLAHSDGIETGPYLGETIGLIHVEGTPNVEVQNNPGNPTNQRGYSVVSYLRPYRSNRIILDTRNTDNDTVIASGVTELVPRRGAIAKIQFNVVKATQLLVSLKLTDGRYVPFGADVKDGNGNDLTLVGQAGQALFSSDQTRLTMNIKWGKKTNQRCRTTIDTANGIMSDGIYMIDAQCQLISEK